MCAGPMLTRTVTPTGGGTPMLVDHVTLETHRTGSRVTLVVQGRPVGLKVHFTRPEFRRWLAELRRCDEEWPPDYYSVLGVDPSASTGAITKAYRKPAPQIHPDLHAGEHEKKVADEKMKLINEAHDTLRDPVKRKV